jgi:hypothetical protein
MSSELPVVNLAWIGTLSDRNLHILWMGSRHYTHVFVQVAVLQWRSEILKHTREGALTVTVYHGMLFGWPLRVGRKGIGVLFGWPLRVGRKGIGVHFGWPLRVGLKGIGVLVTMIVLKRWHAFWYFQSLAGHCAWI